MKREKDGTRRLEGEVSALIRFFGGAIGVVKENTIIKFGAEINDYSGTGRPKKSSAQLAEKVSSGSLDGRNRTNARTTKKLGVILSKGHGAKREKAPLYRTCGRKRWCTYHAVTTNVPKIARPCRGWFRSRAGEWQAMRVSKNIIGPLFTDNR